LGFVACKIVPGMTYYVSGGTLNLMYLVTSHLITDDVLCRIWTAR